MDLVLNVAMTVVGIAGALIAIFGDTNRQGVRWRSKLTAIGWGAAACLVCTLVLGIVKEKRMDDATKKASDDQIRLETKLDATNTDLQRAQESREQLQRDLDTARGLLQQWEQERQLLTRRRESEAFDLGRHKIIFLQIEMVYEYRKNDPTWATPAEMATVESQLDEMKDRIVRLCRLLGAAGASPDFGADSIVLLDYLDDTIRKSHIGRVENAYLLGQILGIMAIESTQQPDGGQFETPVLIAFSGVRDKIHLGDEVILPPSKILLGAVEVLLQSVDNNVVPPKGRLDEVAKSIADSYGW